MFLYHGQLVELEYREYQLPKEFPCIALLRGQYTFPINMDSQLTFLHFHNCLEVGLCHKGKKKLYMEDYHGSFDEGSICAIPPYAIHISHNKEGCTQEDYEYLYFDPEEILKSFYPGGIPGHLLWYKEEHLNPVFTKEDAPVLHSLLTSILDELRSKRPFYEYGVKGLILSLMVEFGRNIHPNSKIWSDTDESRRYQDISSILPALEDIHRNWSMSPEIETLAASCHLSLGQFRRLFKQCLRQNPSSYIRMIQLQKAGELLYSTEKSILDIAMESGFQSLSGFNRAFSSFYGISPGKWRSEKCAVQKKHVKYSPFPLK